MKTLTVIRPSVRVLALTAHFGHQHSLVTGMDHADAARGRAQHPTDGPAKRSPTYQNGAPITRSVVGAATL